MTMAEELGRIQDQEQSLQFKTFNFDTAWALGSYLFQLAQDRGHAVAVEVYGFNQTLFSAARPGTSEEHQIWIKRKRNSVLRFAHSSHYLSVQNASNDVDFNNQPHIDANNFCDHGGSFPITLQGSGIIGAVTVSGLASEEDHALAAEAIAHTISNQ